MKIRVRHMRLRGGAYYFEATPAMRASGIASETLGPDFGTAVKRGEELNARWDDVMRGDDVGPASGSVTWLISRYQASEEYEGLADSTKARDYDPALKRVRAELGEHQIASIRPRHCKAWYRELRRSGKIASSNNVYKVFKLLLGFAVAEELIDVNPAATVKMRAAAARETVWEWEQVCAFIIAADDMGRRSAALAVLAMYELCQRPGDVLRLPRSHYNCTHMHIRQSKTGKPLWLPLGDLHELRRRIEEAIKSHDSTLIIVNEFTGRPYTRENFGVLARKIMHAAGLPNSLQIRDLRRSGMTEAGDAGATDEQLRALSGHETREVVKVYAQRTGSQAGETIRKRQDLRTKSGQKLENAPQKSWKA
jgi:site-specific recombinase XerD